ncbi:MAG TPA: NUDIX hydrolase [Streptosporangiaceae bacterium]|nr:NUDIX hydrolase [Streptosporangiaceae bacterium]
MGDQGAADEIRAAGAIVWRSAGDGARIALVHRPKYDDWSFPKGKLEPGEHVLLAAVREVAEETALRVTLGRRLPPVRYHAADVPKLVDYWVATVAATLSEFEPGNEIDEVAWLLPKGAAAQLSYERDQDTLGEFRAGPRETMPLILVRHASAGSKSRWPKSDVSRPLDSRGTAQALALADLLRCFGAGRVVSAPAERCVATVRPYAASIAAEVEIEAAFDVGASGSDASAVAAAMARLAADNQPVVICGHRENLPVQLDAACAALGAPYSAADMPLRKAEFAVLHRAEGRLAAHERYHPDGNALVVPAPLHFARAGQFAASIGCQSSVGGSEPSRMSSHCLTSTPAPPL